MGLDGEPGRLIKELSVGVTGVLDGRSMGRKLLKDGGSLEMEPPDVDPAERPVGTGGIGKVSSSSEMDGNLASVLDILMLREEDSGGAVGNAGEYVCTGDDEGVDAGDGGPNDKGETRA